MRRAAAVAAALILLVGCGGDDGNGDQTLLEGSITTREVETTITAPASTTQAQPDAAPGTDHPWLLPPEPLANAAGVPRLLVSTGDGIVRVDGGVASELDGVAHDVLGVDGDGSGLVVAERVRTDGEGMRVVVGLSVLRGGTARAVELAPHDTVDLHDVVIVDGRPHLLYSLFVAPGSAATDVTGELYLHDLRDGSARSLAVAAAPQTYLVAASAAAEMVALSYETERTETVEFVDYVGDDVDRPSPTDDLADDGPPFVTDAVASPDGTEIATIEGPDVDGAGDPEQLVGDWQVVVDDADGEQLRLTVADQAVRQLSIDFDGRWLLVSGTTEAGDAAPLLIDTEATDLAVYLVDAARGPATLETAATVAGA